MTECSNCKKGYLISGADCGYHFHYRRRIEGIGVNMGIPSESAVDNYGNCMFYEEARNDITRAIDEMFYSKDLSDWSKMTILEYIRKNVEEYGRIEE